MDKYLIAATTQAKLTGLVDRIARLGAGTGLFILYCTTTALIIDLTVLCLTGEIR